MSMAKSLSDGVISVVKAVLRPLLRPLAVRLKEYLTRDIRREFIEELRIEREKQSDMLKQLVNDLPSVILEKDREFAHDQSVTLTGNGIAEADSYLELAMQNETFELQDFKMKHGEDGWYYLFEKIFRGSEEVILARQRKYLDYFKGCYDHMASLHGSGYFLDIGSGNGEFLSILKEAGIPGRGVDINRLNVERALSKGLSVCSADGLEYLEGLEGGTLFGVSLFQVAEHLDFPLLQRIISAASDKIAPGGILLIETPNPSCTYTMQYFYLDPSHLRPFPPELLKFQLEWAGFVNVKIVYYIPVRQNRLATDPTNYVGYAVIGYKPGA